MVTNKTSQRYLIIALFLIITIDTMGVGFVWPLFGPLFTGKTSSIFSATTAMEWRNILYGITIGTASLFTFLCAPILGDISDYIGRRKVLLFCLLGTSIGMGISALGIIFNQVLLLILSRAWLGAIAASQVIAQAAIIDISVPENKSCHLGVISAANNIGFIFGPILSSLLVDNTLVSWFNLTTPFYFAALLALFSTLFLLKTYKKIDKIQFIKKPIFKNPFAIFARACTNKDIRLTASVYLCLQIGWALYLQTNFLTLIQKYNYGSRPLGYFLSWLGIIFCFSLLVIVRFLTRYVSLKKITYFTLTIAAISCFAAAFYNTEVAIWLNILPMAAAIAIGSNAILTKLSNAANENEQGWAMGIGNSLAALAWAVTPPATGLLLALSFHIPLLLAGTLFSFTVVLGSWFNRFKIT